MPLLDHFGPPLGKTRHWESFFDMWASSISDALNHGLPAPYHFAEMQARSRIRIEDAVTEYEGEPAVRVAPPRFVMPALFCESYGVLVYHGEGGATLVAVVALVAPGNKILREQRRALAAKCATYLRDGIGLLLVDIVTSSEASLHDEMLDLIELGGQVRLATRGLYASSYRPIHRRDGNRVEVWCEPLAIDRRLPRLPLAIDRGAMISLDLEATYTDACHRSRLP